MSASPPALHKPATRPPALAGLVAAGRRALVRLRPGSPCAVCGDWCRDALCADCIARFAMPRWPCRLCALPLPPPLSRPATPPGIQAAAPLCGRCLADPPPVAGTSAALDYAFPWSGLITAFKFHQRLDWAPALAGRLQHCIEQADDGRLASVDLVTAVPLAPARLRERGYNQAWELARRVAHGLGLPARPDVLLRCRDTPRQASLQRSARIANLRGAFAPAPWAANALAGRRVALVDDVLTTGATAFEAAQALRQAGASEVHLWVLARTAAPATDAAAG